MANISNNLDNFTANIWVTIIIIATNDAISSIENMPIALEIMKNQNEKPALTANALNLEEDRSILDRIDECYKTTLCKCCHSN